MPIGRLAGPGPTAGPREVSRADESLPLTTHATTHMASYSVTRVKLVGSSCTFMQVQDSAYTIGGHPTNVCNPLSRPYLLTARRGAPIHGNWQTPSGHLLRYGLRSEGGQRSSPKLEGRRSPLCALHAPASRAHLAAFRCAVCCRARHRIGCWGAPGLDS